MGLRINTNLASMSAQRTMQINRSAEGKASDHLASGSRIVQAADDAAGLSISSTMTAHIRSTNQAKRNSNDAISMVQITEGSLNSIGDILIRFRELAIQASSDTVGDSERRMINTEVRQLREAIDQIASSTEFQGKKLLTGGGSWPGFDVQVGIHSDDNNRLSVDRRSFNSSLDHLGLYGIDFSTKEAARSDLKTIDQSINIVSGYRATLGSFQNRLTTIMGGLGTSSENLSAANSRIKDADIAQESGEMTRTKILGQASTAILSQANQAPNLALKLLG